MAREKIKIRRMKKDSELPDQSVEGSEGKKKSPKRPPIKQPGNLKRSYGDPWDS